MALVILLIKLDLPTLGKPVKIKVRELVSIEGSLPKCFLTSSRYDKLALSFLIKVAILPRAALLSYLHLYKESAYFKSLT